MLVCILNVVVLYKGNIFFRIGWNGLRLNDKNHDDIDLSFILALFSLLK